MDEKINLEKLKVRARQDDAMTNLLAQHSINVYRYKLKPAIVRDRALAIAGWCIHMLNNQRIAYLTHRSHNWLEQQLFPRFDMTEYENLRYIQEYMLPSIKYNKFTNDIHILVTLAMQDFITRFTEFRERTRADIYSIILRHDFADFAYNFEKIFHSQYREAENLAEIPALDILLSALKTIKSERNSGPWDCLVREFVLRD